MTIQHRERLCQPRVKLPGIRRVMHLVVRGLSVSSPERIQLVTKPADPESW